MPRGALGHGRVRRTLAWLRVRGQRPVTEPHVRRIALTRHGSLSRASGVSSGKVGAAAGCAEHAGARAVVPGWHRACEISLASRAAERARFIGQSGWTADEGAAAGECGLAFAAVADRTEAPV